MSNKGKNFRKGKKQTGITLVALVVTIVILLILAGVSISLILDNNGIIQKSKVARTQYGEASENEEIALNTAYDDMNAVLDDEDTNKNLDIFECDGATITGIKSEYLVQSTGMIETGKYASLKPIRVLAAGTTSTTEIIPSATYTRLKDDVGTVLTIPSSINGVTITKIGDSAFEGIENLEKVTLPESIIDIGKQSFFECRKLNSINLPDELNSIGKLGFYNTALTQIYIPDSVQWVDYGAFGGDGELRNILTVNCEFGPLSSWNTEWNLGVLEVKSGVSK